MPLPRLALRCPAFSRAAANPGDAERCECGTAASVAATTSKGGGADCLASGGRAAAALHKWQPLQVQERREWAEGKIDPVARASVPVGDLRDDAIVTLGTRTVTYTATAVALFAMGATALGAGATHQHQM